MRRHLPAALIALRLMLGPLMLLVAANGEAAPLLAAMIVAATLSDIFDGVLARRWGVATEALRVADSRVDIVFIGCAVAALWRVRAVVLRAFLPALATLAAAAVAGAVLDLAK